MKEIIEFLKQRRNIKYSLGIIIFGLIFAFSFQVNRTQIPEEPLKLKIDLKTKEGREHLIDGWKEERGLVWLVGRTIVEKIPQIWPEKKPLLKPERIKEYYKLGKKYYKEGQYSKARKEFRKVSTLNPEYKEVKRYLEKIQSKIGTERKVERKCPKEEKVIFKKEAILKISLPERKTYQMVIKAFSCSPPDARDQMIEVYFNDIALDRLRFRKTSRWQKFSVNIPSFLLKETNTIKFVYTQDIRSSPVAFDSLELRNYTFRIRGFYLLFDSPIKKRADYLSPRVLSYSFGFAISLLLFWLFYSRFLFFAVKMKFSRAIKIDFLSYLPSIILLSLLALISFFSPYHFVFSFKTFFVLALAPTAVLKLFPYKELPLRLIRIILRFIFRDIEKTCSEIKRAYSACLSFFSFLKRQITTFRKFLIRYHKTNLSSAFILDFMILLVLCAICLMIKAARIAEQIANLAYFLLVIGVAMEAVAFFREGRKKG